jgi:WD40 repeat protein
VVDTPGEESTVRVYALGNYEEPVWVLEPAGDEPQFIVQRDRVSGLAFDPSGARLLVSYNDRPSRLIDVASWTPIDDDEFEERDILRGFWSRDGRLVATSANDGTISIRDGSTFEVIRVLVGSAGDEGFRFSPDDSLLVSIADETLWDVESGARIGVGFTNDAIVQAHANADDDGLRFITGTEGTALIWSLDTDTWADLACRVAGSNLTAAEWDEWGPSDTDRYAICPQYELP